MSRHRLTALRPRRVLLVCMLSSACFVARLDLDVSRENLDAELAASIRRVEVVVVAVAARDGGAVTCASLRDGSRPLDDEALRVFYRESFTVSGAAPPPVGHLPEGRILSFARAFDGSCATVAEGCTEFDVVSGEGGAVLVSLEPRTPPVSCGVERACVDGECRACTVDWECDDGDPCSIDDCDAGVCGHVAGSADLDEDGYADARCAGGVDCDDSSASAHPGASRRCGLGLDHDCNGIVDDAEGCGTCPGATGLVYRAGASIATPAVGVSTIGPAPDGPLDQVLFVGTPSQIQVYDAPAGGTPTLVGASAFPGVTPSAPVVVGDYVLVADVQGDGAIMVYSRDDLRAGDAEPLTRVGAGLGVLSAFTADARSLFANAGSGTGALATATVASLPDLDEPEIVLASGEWKNCRALARDGSDEGGWLVGVLGRDATWARLGATGDIVETGVAELTDGYGSDVALAAGRAFLAQGDMGLVAIDLERLSASDPVCCSLADQSNLFFPLGCSGSDCRSALAVAVASEDRAVVMGFSNSAVDRVVLYLVDISDVTAMRVVDEAPLSDSRAIARDVVVSGNVVFAAGRVGETPEGVVDLFDLTCE